MKYSFGESVSPAQEDPGFSKDYRDQLAQEIKETHGEERKEVLKNAKSADEYWNARHDKISSQNEEIPTEDGLGVFIKHVILYHGSTIADIEELKNAEDTTVGEGLYLTSEAQSAIGYANIRAKGKVNQAKTYELKKQRGPVTGDLAALLGNPEDAPKGDANAVPIIYEVTFENMKLLDLRTDENVNKIIEGYRNLLLSILTDGREKNSFIRQGQIHSALKEMSAGRFGKGTLRNITYGLGDIFSEYVKSLGYEGLITFEGGESFSDTLKVNDHDTYVIFDPGRVKINNEQGLHLK